MGERLFEEKRTGQQRTNGDREITPHQRREALQRLAAGETQAAIARTYNVDATTIGRLEPRPFEHASAGAA
jgi:DNA invertase Pin-like site-specific DNA recombinase